MRLSINIHRRNRRASLLIVFEDNKKPGYYIFAHLLPFLPFPMPHKVCPLHHPIAAYGPQFRYVGFLAHFAAYLRSCHTLIVESMAKVVCP